MVQGLGPGFTTVAMRRSVIFRVEGLELGVHIFDRRLLIGLGFRSAAAPAQSVAEEVNRLLLPILPAF